MFETTFITLFPEAFPGPLGVSILERARREGIWDWETIQLREFGLGKHRNVDAPPTGGGAGMVLRPDVAAAALDSIVTTNKHLIYLSPRGKPFTQEMAREYAASPGLVMFCGRFEGLDQRVIETHDLEEVSMGDFVLAGGEVAAMALTEAVVRLLPGVAGMPTP
jgi:tRNA (guanine37-N1)-methyltransferase